ncbi:MAG: glycosyltransferase family 39 protein [Bryobacteraceae bacterium]|nr:glycosyltransferase family 39 protein [Bryobacteraceae bacterium]
MFLLTRSSRELGSQVMTEMMLCFVLLLAAMACVRLVESGKLLDGVVLGLAATVAILTKANALVLAPLPLLLVLGSQSTRLLRTLAFWLPAGIVGLACAPWYLATLGPAKEGWDPSSNVTWLARNIAMGNAGYVIGCVGLPLFLAACLGVWDRLATPAGTIRESRWLMPALFIPLHWVFFSLVTPVGEERHFLYSIPPSDARVLVSSPHEGEVP